MNTTEVVCVKPNCDTKLNLTISLPAAALCGTIDINLKLVIESPSSSWVPVQLKFVTSLTQK